MEMKHLPKFAVLQLSGCAGCEVSLLNAEEWIDQFNLVYMPLAVSAHEVPEVDILLVSGGVRNSQDIYKLKTSSKKAGKIVAVGTCAISGGVANLGNREDVRRLFLSQETRIHLPQILPKSKPIDYFVSVDQYLPGCPPTPELFMALLLEKADLKPSKTVCQECGRKKMPDMRPEHFIGFQKGEVLPDICLINQGYPCVGTSTRGGCMALCTRPGHPCVGCRGPSDAFIEKESQQWLASVQKVFEKMTNVPSDEIYEVLRSPQLSLFLFQFSDYAGINLPPRPKEKVL
jgi:F420-non-reducing hydrogenase small subunit